MVRSSDIREKDGDGADVVTERKKTNGKHGTRAHVRGWVTLAANSEGVIGRDQETAHKTRRWWVRHARQRRVVCGMRVYGAGRDIDTWLRQW